MKMIKLLSATSVLLLASLPIVANSDSQADRQHDSRPIETWGDPDVAMERIMMMTEVEPTAAGSAPANYDPDAPAHSSSHTASSMHSSEASRNASRYKMQIFGTN